jgi:hypothetical protein
MLVYRIIIYENNLCFLLLAGRNGDMRLTDDREMSGDDVAGLWTGYHNALGLKKSTPPSAREQSVSMETVFRGVTPCSLIEVYRRFRGACCLHHQGDQ